MNLEGYLLFIFILFLFSLPLLIWHSVCKDRKRLIKLAENIKKGDIYKCEYQNRNPFEPNIVCIVRIEEIRKNKMNEFWVRYWTVERIPQLKTQELIAFLADYTFFGQETKQEEE